MSNYNDTTVEHTEHNSNPNGTKIIMKTLGILTVITIFELVIGMFIAPKFPEYKHLFNGLYLIATLLKAFYIVSEFMHLGHEVKNLIYTIVFPLVLFVWFIIAFLWDGSSFSHLRDKYNPKIPVKSEQVAHHNAE